MSWKNKNKKKINNSEKKIINEPSSNLELDSLTVTKIVKSDDGNFRSFVDSAPLLVSAVASADGKSIELLFSVSPAPILPIQDPKFFDVKFDGISVPIISIKRNFINFKNSCRAGTTSSTLQASYNNTAKTLTGAQEVLILDTVTLNLNDRVLVKNFIGDKAPWNGIYTLTQLGVASTTPWILTRSEDANTAEELAAMAVTIDEGTSSNLGVWKLATTSQIILGVTNLTFEKVEGQVGKSYIVNLASPIKQNMEVSVDYYPGETNVVTNSSNTPDPLLAFSNFPVDVSNVQFPFGYFDPLSWAVNGYLGSVPNGILYEQRLGFVSPPITYDNELPIGDTLLHISKSKLLDGLRIHYFGCYTTNNDTETSANLIPGKYFIQDVFEFTVREAETFGGAEEPTEYEVIGDGYNYYLVHYLSQEPGVANTVKSIEFGITSVDPKNYVLEVMKTSTSPWAPIIYMLATDGTKEYFRYVFKTALKLFAVRIRYRGDYFYKENSGLVTVSASDRLSGSEAIRISHFSDFRDAQEFAENNFPTKELLNPQGEGWIAFVDGTAFYNWDIVNRSRVWDEYSTVAGSGIGTKIISFQNILIAVVDNKIYTLDKDGISTLAYDASDTIINTYTIYRNRLYFGLENGSILLSETGLTYSIPSQLQNLPPIKSLLAFRNQLCIGTGLDVNNRGYLYYFRPNPFGEFQLGRRSFGEYEILSLGKTSTHMYLGLGTGPEKGLIYSTEDVATFTLIYSSGEDRIDVIAYNNAEKQLWFGAAKGTISAFEFKEDGQINKILPIKILGASITFKFYNFVESPTNDLFWIVTNRTDGNVMVYNTEFDILYDSFRPDNVILNDVTYFNNQVYGIGSNGKIYKVDLSLFNTNEKMVYLQIRDLAGNITTQALSDGIIYGSPPNIIQQTGGTSTFTKKAEGKIYRVRIPITYVQQNTATADYFTYKTIQKWAQGDGIIVYRAANINAERIIVNASEYENNFDGSITFEEEQDENAKIFITIASPDSGLLSLRGTPFTSSGATSALFAPSKVSRQVGVYETEPFYAPSLNRWNELSLQMYFANVAVPITGEEHGLQVDVYVRSANRREDLYLSDWGNPFTYSTINTTSLSGAVINRTYSIQNFRGKFIQIKAELSSASINVSPQVNFMTLTYYSANDSYFFTRRFDTSDKVLEEPYPEFKRGLLTYNGALNGGEIQFKYLASDNLNDSFNISKYEDITPNSIFELPSPSRYIRFAILLVSAGDESDPDTLAIVDEFAVQLDTGAGDLYWMKD